MTDKIISTNRMSLRQLIIRENSQLDFVTNPNTGKLFFVCGTKRGYVSPNAQAKMATGTVDDFQYAEVSINGKEAIPCLMIVGDGKQNVKRSIGAELLR